MKRTTIIGVALIAVMGAVLASYATLISSRTVSNSIGVAGVGVGVFSDSGCTTALTSINWGILYPGGVGTHTLYVRNNGTVPVTLTMTIGNWNPMSASGNFTITWNQEDTILASSSVTPAAISLTVSANAIGIASVTFDITITGTY